MEIKNKKIKLLLTEKQLNVLSGEAVINTIASLICDADEEWRYDKEACRQLIKNIKNL